MMIRKKLLAALVASLALAPVLAAGSPACCKPLSNTAPSHACCAAKTAPAASAPKGCCKAPVAPRTDAKAKDALPIALSIPQTIGSPSVASGTLPDAVLERLARHAHHAVAPDDSPPDILSQTHVLLI
jgi:hypothetical protein